MKTKFICAVLFTVVFCSCSIGDTKEKHTDSANMLQDTLPANGLIDSMSPDSNPADAAHVDSLSVR